MTWVLIIIAIATAIVAGLAVTRNGPRVTVIETRRDDEEEGEQS